LTSVGTVAFRFFFFQITTFSHKNLLGILDRQAGKRAIASPIDNEKKLIDIPHAVNGRGFF